MDKITWTEAVKMENSIGAYTIHISWIPVLESENLDCSAVVIDPDKNWRDPTSHLFLVLDDPDLEASIGGFYTRLAKRDEDEKDD